ncbi:hypothetical protein M0802_008098 [Mischocyttarus mexicanus]|nr:hypothetical protein M0802_008098 [Mischocyttarus mexicanus]
MILSAVSRDIDVACHNGPESSTISGPSEFIKAFVAELQLITLLSSGYPFLSTLGKLHNLGIPLKVGNRCPPIPYPVCKGTPSISSLIRWENSADW